MWYAGMFHRSRLSGRSSCRKFRTTWISYDALAAVHHYLDLDRPATVDGTAWRPPPRWGEPLLARTSVLNN